MLTDTIYSLGIMICFYYGLTAFACIWFFRNELFESASSIVFKLLFPLLGGIGLFGVLAVTLRDSASPDYGSGASIFGVGLVLVLGLGLILVGLVLMLVWRSAAARVLPRRDAAHGHPGADRLVRCGRHPPRPFGVGGASIDGFWSKKPEGLSQNDTVSTDMIGHSSIRVMWWMPKTYHRTTSVFSSGASSLTHSLIPVSTVGLGRVVAGRPPLVGAVLGHPQGVPDHRSAQDTAASTGSIMAGKQAPGTSL